MQSAVDWYLSVVRDHYADFNGRAGRAEFWYFVLVNFVISCVLAFIARIIHPFGIIEGLYALAVLIPSIAVTVRRLHDSDKSGWLALLWIVPFVGWLIVLVLCIMEGTPGPNQYGNPPSETVATAAA